MSYKRKDGTVISRRDFEKITDSELVREFSPSGETPNKSFDGEEFVELTQSQAASDAGNPDGDNED